MLPWGLCLVVCALQKLPFEANRDTPLKDLTFKVAFLIAITLVKRVSLVRSCSSYLTQTELSCVQGHPFSQRFFRYSTLMRTLKWKSETYHSYALLLSIQKSLHCQDVVRAIKVYLKAMAPVKWMDFLFVLCLEPRKAHPPLKSTIA